MTKPDRRTRPHGGVGGRGRNAARGGEERGGSAAGGRWPTLDGLEPLVIAHRGASGYLPEHTIEAYQLAIELGADFIEPDLVATRDGQLVARHDPLLDATTDVAAHGEFAARRTTRVVDGVEVTGFFVCDFTLKELRTLRAIQLRPGRPQHLDRVFRIPAFDEVLALARDGSASRGRPVGVYPETKHPTWHAAMGLPLEEPLLAALARFGWTEGDAPVLVQSFETANLRALRRRCEVRLVQLVGATGLGSDGAPAWAPGSERPFDRTLTGSGRTWREMLTPEGLAEIAGYADGIGPWKRFVVGLRPSAGAASEAELATAPPGDLVARAHAAGLFVHVWTFRDEVETLAFDYAGDPGREIRQFLELGVDGLFADFPDRALAVRSELGGELEVFRRGAFL